MPKLLDKLDLPRLDGAQCMDTDPELWFEASDGAPDPEKLAELRAICGACPSRQRCLDYATKRDMHGVWGGLTQAERAPLLPVKSGPVCRECGTEFVRAGAPKQYCKEACRRVAQKRLARAANRRYEASRAQLPAACPKGHDYDLANTDYMINGARSCRACKGPA